jgi:hypothetical protein
MKNIMVMFLSVMFCVGSFGEAQSQNPFNWQYTERSDEMGRGKAKLATVISQNTVKFAFPYAGINHMSIVIINYPVHGELVSLRITKGQFLDSDGIAVRFDNDKEQRYSIKQVKPNMVAVFPPDKFIADLRKARSLRIEAMFFNEGNRVFRFDVSGLKW